MQGAAIDHLLLFATVHQLQLVAVIIVQQQVIALLVVVLLVKAKLVVELAVEQEVLMQATATKKQPIIGSFAHHLLLIHSQTKSQLQVLPTYHMRNMLQLLYVLGNQGKPDD